MNKGYETLNVWKVTYESKDDGHRLTDSYYGYFQREDADKRAEQLFKGAVVQDSLLQAANGSFYEYQLKRVYTNVPSRSKVLKKLTDEEKYTLGLLDKQ